MLLHGGEYTAILSHDSASLQKLGFFGAFHLYNLKISSFKLLGKLLSKEAFSNVNVNT